MTILPNFFIVGAGKAGTTSLYHYLKQHPDVFLPAVKEPHYYSFRGVRPHGPWKDVEYIKDKSIYEALFDTWDGHKAIGEVSASYLYYPEAATGIKKDIPGAKIIIILRSPIERAFSNYRHLIRIGLERNRNFGEVIRDDSASAFDYLTQGFYHAQVARYLSTFGRDNVMVVLYSELVDSAGNLMQDFCHYLEIDSTFHFITDTRHNRDSGYPRLPRFHLLIKKLNISKLLNRTLKRKVKAFFTPIYYHEMQLKQEDFHYLLNLYSADIDKLAQLLNRDLGHWKIYRGAKQ